MQPPAAISALCARAWRLCPRLVCATVPRFPPPCILAFCSDRNSWISVVRRCTISAPVRSMRCFICTWVAWTCCSACKLETDQCSLRTCLLHSLTLAGTGRDGGIGVSSTSKMNEDDATASSDDRPSLASVSFSFRPTHTNPARPPCALTIFALVTRWTVRPARNRPVLPTLSTEVPTSARRPSSSLSSATPQLGDRCAKNFPPTVPAALDLRSELRHTSCYHPEVDQKTFATMIWGFYWKEHPKYTDPF